MDQRLILFHELVVGDVQRNHDARNLRRDGHRPAIGVGVVGAFKIAGRQPVVDAARQQKRDDGEADHRDERRRSFRFASSDFPLSRPFERGAALDLLAGFLAFAGYRCPHRREADRRSCTTVSGGVSDMYLPLRGQSLPEPALDCTGN